MSRVAVIAEHSRAAGFVLTGADVHIADAPDEVLAAWRGLAQDTGLLIVSPAAAEALGPRRLQAERPLTAVMPP